MFAPSTLIAVILGWSMTDANGGDAGESPVIETIRGIFPKTKEKGFVRKDIISEGWGIELVQDPDEAMRARDAARIRGQLDDAVREERYEEAARLVARLHALRRPAPRKPREDG